MSQKDIKCKLQETEADLAEAKRILGWWLKLFNELREFKSAVEATSGATEDFLARLKEGD